MYRKVTRLFIGMLLIPSFLLAQHTELIPFGDFEQWQVREITESGLLGGNTYEVYDIAPNDTIHETVPYISENGWSSSNVMAKVIGIVKSSISVFPETRDNGRCARLESCFAQCKVLGIVNVKVMVSGSIFLGQTLEPIRDQHNPYSKINMGIPFTKRPSAFQFDFKCYIDPDSILTRATGTRTVTLPGKDEAEVILFLQHRWEDEEGNLYAKRVGTAGIRIKETIDTWQNGVIIPIVYGDARQQMEIEPYLDLYPDMFYAKNSQGDNVPLQELEWAAPDEPITHIILKISSGSQGAYIGALGNTLWVDNVAFCYE